MTSMSYDEIFSHFLGRIYDFNMARLNESDAYDLMGEYLKKTVAKAYVRNLFSSLTLDDEIQQLSFELNYATDDDSDYDFVRNILTKGMVVEWLEPQVQSKINLSQYFSTGDSRFFSQANHITELRAMLEDTKIELRSEIRDRGFISNSYLEGAT